MTKKTRDKNNRGKAHIYEYRIVRPDGEVRHVRELEYGIVENDGVLLQSAWVNLIIWLSRMKRRII